MWSTFSVCGVEYLVLESRTVISRGQTPSPKPVYRCRLKVQRAQTLKLNPGPNT